MLLILYEILGCEYLMSSVRLLERLEHILHCSSVL